jgi:5-(carboxyamino)imidazole ribonucleotide synthase
MRIGLLGGGQLARMLALAGWPLGMEFTFFCPEPYPCAAGLGEHLRGEYDNLSALEQFAGQVDRITYEFENIPAETVRHLAGLRTICPSVEALAVSQDRLSEKRFFQSLQIPTIRFQSVDTLEDLTRALCTIGTPALLKTRCQGYDGKGQALVQNESECEDAWKQIGGQPAILEAMVPFDREVSMIGVRSKDDTVCFYPLTENRHQSGILRCSKAIPDDPMQKPAEQLLARLLRSLDYVGVITLELFQVGDRLLANEFAPRVHNSGHWTIEGAETSQFENHLRAVSGLPLGSTALKAPSAMVNFIGSIPCADQVLKLPGVHFHTYAKPPRPGRKLGHATVCTNNRTAFLSALDRLNQLADSTTS